jgi:hypothetical protein
VFGGHVVVRLLEVLEQKTQKTTGGKQHQGFFVKDVDFLGNQKGKRTSGQGDEASLGNEVVAGKSIDDAVGLFLGLFYILRF